LQTFHDPSGASGANDHFGASVSISDGTIIIGESGSSTGGAAYIYNANGTNGIPMETLLNPASGSNYFGVSVGVSDGTAVVGDLGYNGNNGTAYAYESATTGVQVTVENSVSNVGDNGNYAAFQVSAFDGKNSVVGTLGGAAGDTYTITGGDTGYNHLTYGGGFNTLISGDASPVFNIVGNQLVVNDATALDYNLNQSFTLEVHDATTNTDTTVAVFVSDPFSGATPTGELMDNTAGGLTINASTNNQMVWGGTGTVSDTLFDNGNTGDALIGSNAGGNVIQVSNNLFSFIDGGAGPGNLLQLSSTGAGITLDFTGDSGTIGTVKDIENIDLGVANTGSNSIKLNIQDVFNMTEGSGSNILYITDSPESATNGNVTVVADGTANNNIFHLQAGQTPGSTQQTLDYSGTYVNAAASHTVTLVIEAGTTNVTGGGVHVATAAS